MTEDERLDIALFRYAVIRPLLAEDLTVGERRALRAEICAQTHDIPHSHKTRIAARTLRRWLQRYREAGFEGLKPRSRSDRGRPRRLAPAVIEQAAALRRELPTRSIGQLIALLEATGHAAPGQVKPSTLARVLRARGLTRQALAAPKRIYRHFEAPHRNALWQADLSHGPYLPHPHDPDKRRKTYLLAILDDRSRLVVYAAFFWEQDVAALEVALRQAILRYGVPERLYVDNGKIFVARRVQLACARLGIELVRQTPYRPEGKGKIERFFGTV
ncbi:MAG TPA: DDE-type integrase/transposase/recombinase, partial [Bacillota bacterium]